MSAVTKPANVNIMGKEYLVMCSDEERTTLDSAADLLNARMEEAKNSGNLIGSEKIAVLAALNIAHEMLLYRKIKDRHTFETDNVLDRIKKKIEVACTLAETRLSGGDYKPMDNI